MPRVFHILQEYEGVVEEVYDDSLVAIIRDLTNITHPNTMVTFPFDRIPDSEMAGVRVGNGFYFAVGYYGEHERDRIANIKFYNDQITKDVIKRARKEGEDIAKLAGWVD